MTDETIEDIRERKRRELVNSGGETTGTGGPTEPVTVDGSDEFQQVVADHDVVLVDFHAEWCGPCKMLAPKLSAVAAETDAAVLKVDIDANQALASEYQVQGVPTLYLFHNGDVEDRMVGMQDEATLKQKIAAVQ